MKEKEKLEKIKRIVEKTSKEFQQAKLVYVKDDKGKITGVGVSDTKAEEQKKLEENFYVYAKALEEIAEIVGAENFKEPVIKEE